MLYFGSRLIHGLSLTFRRFKGETIVLHPFGKRVDAGCGNATNAEEHNDGLITNGLKENRQGVFGNENIWREKYFCDRI